LNDNDNDNAIMMQTKSIYMFIYMWEESKYKKY